MITGARLLLHLVLLLALADGATPKKTFVLSAGDDIDTLDWTIADTGTEATFLKNIMEGLFDLTTDGRVVPQLAESFQVSSDGLVYTFQLRKGVKWSDGRELKASDFVDAWKRLFAPLSLTPAMSFLFVIAGAEDYHARRLKSFQDVGVKALSPSTLEVRLRKPCAFFPKLLTLWPSFPVRADLIGKYGPVAWTSPENIAVLGPFTVATFEKHKRLILKRNPSYHGAPSELDELDIEIVSDDASAPTLYDQNKLDYLGLAKPSQLPKSAMASEVHRDPMLVTSYLLVNPYQFPFTFAGARKALALAFDKSKLAAILGPQTKFAPSFIPPELLPGVNAPAPAVDRAAALTIFKESVPSPIATIPPLELVIADVHQNARLAEFIKDELALTFGLKVKIELEAYLSFRQRVRNRSGTFFINEWGADYLDPHTFADVFRSNAGTNLLGWKSARYDELVEKAGETPDGPERSKLYAEAERVLQQEDPALVPLYYPTNDFIMKPRITSLRHTPIGDIHFAEVKIK